ncbi:MAG: hypothetical protein QNJ40_20525 [Xanthomonadales bacterium]|nr:hypothetical protein [Xanthomonadales bacterium]
MAPLLFIAGLSQASDDSLLIGEWACEMKSEYMDATKTLTINDDSSYELVTEVFGSRMVDLGKWSKRGETLSLNREYHVKRGEKKASSQEFLRTITKLDENNLEFTNENAITTCVK